MSLIFGIADFKESDVRDAVESKWDDFEDSVQAVIAYRIDADYIITRNVKDFKQSKVIAFTPAEFIAHTLGAGSAPS